jgi:hypothetical protein
MITTARAMVRRDGVTFVNTSAKVPDESWAQLAPFGDWDNASGMQRFRAEDAHTIVNEFSSMAGLPQRALGLPWYVGHPDFPAMKDRYTDTAAKGRIRKLDVREDANCAACRAGKGCKAHGLFANVEWNDDGKALIAKKAFHGHSVNWRMRKEGAVWRPFTIKSVGFTNEPQIPVAPVTFANEEQTEADAVTFVNETAETKTNGMKKLTDYIKKFLGKADTDELDEETMVNECEKKHAEMANELETAKKAGCACEADKGKLIANETLLITTLAAAGITVTDSNATQAFINEFTASRTARTEAEAKLAEREKQFANEKTELETKLAAAEAGAAKAAKLEMDFANERKARIELVLNDAIQAGRITAAERPVWEKDFANEAAFSDTLDRFTKLPKKLKTQSSISAGDLGKRNSDTRSRMSQVIDAVNERMDANRKDGKQCDYDYCFAQIKAEKPALFAEMQKPEAQVTTGR